MSEWISVGTNVPDDDVYVICTNESGDYMVGNLILLKSAFYDSIEYRCYARSVHMSRVTHWMPLPKPPEAKL